MLCILPRYVDGALNKEDLFAILLIFNVPKLMFVIHLLKKILCSYSNDKLFEITFSILMMITIPLVPYMIVSYSKSDAHSLFEPNKPLKGSRAKYYWIMVLYLFFSYIGSCLYVAVRIDIHNLSIPVQVSMIGIVLLVLLNLVSLPIGWKKMKQSGVNVELFKAF